MIKVKLSALHRAYREGGMPTALAVYTILRGARAIEPVRGQIDAWVVVGEREEPLINTLLISGSLYPSEVKQ